MNLALLAAQTTDSGTKMEIGDAALVALVGYGVVFLGIVMLMVILYITGSIFKKRDAKAAAAKAADAKTEAKAAPVAEKSAPVAPGSAGHVKLNGVPDKDAAMIMAIVADKLQTPLNELRFISIKEVE
ncbi:MAG: OadG family protein [Clostridia bacterium]|nr:OadG family protein [Clostridia bacterium]